MARKLMIEIVFLVLLAGASIPFLTSMGRLIEPRLFPVVTMASFEETDTGFYAVRFSKLRDCELIGVYWFVGDTWLRQPFGNQFTRPPGVASVSEWKLPDRVDLSTARSVARHKCHPIWITQTPFYKPKT